MRFAVNLHAPHILIEPSDIGVTIIISLFHALHTDRIFFSYIDCCHIRIIHLAEYIPIYEIKCFLQAIFELFYRPSGTKGFFFDEILNLHTEPRPIAEIILDYLREILERNKEFPYAIFLELLDVPLEQRFPENRNHWFRQGVRHRTKPSS